MTWQHQALLFGAAALAGAVNSVAGGGTLLTFPALLMTGQPSLIANATSTVALWPGQLSSLWGYRKEIGKNRAAILALAVPSLFGGLLGAILLLRTPTKTFDSLVPYLVLAATALFSLQEPLARWQKRRAERNRSESEAPPAEASAPLSLPAVAPRRENWAGIVCFQFLVAIYGGYFGAGIGILMLAALGFMGFSNIHQMNGLKNINGLIINALAAALFIGNGMVDWKIALWMALGSILGGYVGAGTARRIGQRNVRRIIILIGFALTISLFVKG